MRLRLHKEDPISHITSPRYRPFSIELALYSQKSKIVPHILQPLAFCQEISLASLPISLHTLGRCTNSAFSRYCHATFFSESLHISQGFASCLFAILVGGEKFQEKCRNLFAADAAGIRWKLLGRGKAATSLRRAGLWVPVHFSPTTGIATVAPTRRHALPVSLCGVSGHSVSERERERACVSIRPRRLPSGLQPKAI